MQVVLLHGFGENAGIWDSLIPLLPDNFEYITPDYSRITFCQTIDEYAEWLHSEIEERKITRFILIGHSMGGYISMAYAAKFKGYLAGLGLFHSTTYADSEEKKSKRDKTVTFLEKFGTATFIEGFLPNIYSLDFQRKNSVYIQKQLVENKQIPAQALITATIAMKMRVDTRKVLASLDFPVLMIIGKKDEFVSYSDSLEQLTIIKHPHVLIQDHVAHGGMMESPKAVSAVITSFLIESEK